MAYNIFVSKKILVALKSVAYVFCVFEWIGGSGGGGSRFGRKIRPDQRCKSTSRHRGVRHRTGTHRHFGRYCAEGGVEQGWNFQGRSSSSGGRRRAGGRDGSFRRGGRGSSSSIGVPTLALCPTRKQIDGIASTHVVGRFHEVRMSERLTFFVDCAHTAESVEHCSKWFQTVSPASSSDAGHRALRILIFTVTGNRNPLVMLRRLETLRFDVVYFAGFIASSLARVGPKLPCPCDCKTVWEELASSTPSYELVGDQLVQFLKSLKTWDGTSPLTLNFGTVKPRGIHVLVTGSVYLVGDVLSALRPEYSITWT
ncbi:Folylpolyglutamate synthase mitochondrial [Taenia solium]|eukprot:TsM_000839000 transcript=TsM_000839000 gene=TsM_000839000